jgi:hypothetical protein
MNTAISTALGSYTNTTGMNTTISTASTNTSNYIFSKFLPLIGGTLTNILYGTTINATTNLQEAGRNLSSKYLKLDGTNDMSGALTLHSSTLDNQIVINNTATNRYSAIKFVNGTKNGYIGIGCTATTGTYQNNLFIEANNSIIFATNGTNSSTAIPTMIINTSGNVGVGILNPNCRLYISANLATSATVYAMRLACGAATDGGGFGTLLGLGSEGNGWSKCAIGHTRTGNYDRGAIVFLTRDTADGADCTMADERMRISSTGTVNIVNTLQVANNDINNFLFNNTGRNHATYTDFNAIDKFGYTFIQSATNGPPTGATQFYSWYIGLGNEYPFANSVNGYYGMQFAVGRNEEYPKLSVRRKENNVWSAWQGLTSERAVSLTTGNKTVSGILTVQHSSTSFNAADGGLYVYNPNNTANSCSVLGVRIAGSTASKAGISIDVNNVGGWSIYMNGNDTTDRYLRFNNSWSGTQSEFLQIRGSDGFTAINGATNISGLLTVNNNMTINGGSQLNGGLSVTGNTSLAQATNIGGLLRHRQSFNYGETIYYTVGYNGGNQSDWFWTTNGFWDGYGTASYLTIAITATGNSAVWFGRAFLGQGGGFYSIIQDYRNPNGGTNTISVVDYWGPYGANSLRISIANPVYGGNFVIKVSG